MRKKDEEPCETSGRGRRRLTLVCALALGAGASFACLNPRPEELPSNIESAPATGADDASRQSGPSTFDAPAAGGDADESTSGNLVPGPTSAEAPPSTFDAPVGDAGVGADAGGGSDAGAD